MEKYLSKKKGKICCIYKISAGQPLLIDNLSFGIKIRLFQGYDCIKELSFEKDDVVSDTLMADSKLWAVLKSCGEPIIPIPHSIGSVAERLTQYPKTKQCNFAKHRYSNRRKCYG